ICTLVGIRRARKRRWIPRSRPQHRLADERGRLLHLEQPRLQLVEVPAPARLLGPLHGGEDPALLLGRQLALEGLDRAHGVGDEAVELPHDRFLLLAALLRLLLDPGLGHEPAELGLAEAARRVDDLRMAAASGLVLRGDGYDAV